MKTFIPFMLIIFSLFLISCDCDCTEAMDKTRAKYGAPEEISTYKSSGYNTETWWYWSKGRSYTFAWGSNVDECCDKSTYTFSPINNTDAINYDSLKNVIKFKESEKTTRQDLIINPN